MTHHPDHARLREAIALHNQQMLDLPDNSETLAGVHGPAILHAGAFRSRAALREHAAALSAFSPSQLREIEALMSQMWMDGFAIRHVYDNPSAFTEETS